MNPIRIFIRQPLKGAIVWQPKGSRYERTGFTESLRCGTTCVATR